MSIDKSIALKLKKFAGVFKEAKEREANESDTVMYLVQFFKEVLGYDPLAGEISKEIAVNDRYCDFGIKLENQTVFLVEAKHAGIKSLSTKHIEQAENYGSRAGINWVILTSGVLWQLYHLTFSSTGIEHELVFEFNFPEELEKSPDSMWDALSVLVKSNVLEKSLDTYYEQQKLLCPKVIVSTLLDWEVLAKIRQQLNREAPARLEIQAVFDAVVKVLNTKALADAGNFKAPTKRHHRRRRANGREQMEDQATEMPNKAQPQAAVKEQTAPPAPASPPKVTP